MLGGFDKMAFRFEKKHFTPPEFIESLTGTLYKHLTPNGVRGRLCRAIFLQHQWIEQKISRNCSS